MLPSDGRVITNFIIQSLSGHDITIFSNGSQTRSFCFVDNLIASFLAMHFSNPSVIGPINLRTKDDFIMLDFTRKH